MTVEKIATETKQIAEKVDRIDKRTGDQAEKIENRVATLEAEPARKYNKYKETIITSVITLIVGLIIGGLLALVIK